LFAVALTSLLVAGVADPVSAAAPAKRRTCAPIVVVGERYSVRTFGRPLPHCAGARKRLRVTFDLAMPNGARKTISGWRCRWTIYDYGGKTAECTRRGRTLMAWNAEYGE
jgi:hypothetical protein